MSYEIGQRVRVPLTIKDVTGTPIDATVVVSVRREDGTVFPAPTVVDDPGTGAYHFDVLVDASGIWQWTATASGAVDAVVRGQFYVRTGALGVISLREAKEHLNKRLEDTSDDDELLDWIDAIGSAIEKRVGPVIPKTYIDTFTITTPVDSVTLRNRPVMSVASVVEYWGAGDTRTLTAETLGGPYGDNDYLLDVKTGSITRRSGGVRMYFPYGTNVVWITYVAGRRPIPANLRLAAKELLAHHWRASQIATGSTRPRTDVPADTASLGIAIPNRVNILLGDKRAPRLGG